MKTKYVLLSSLVLILGSLAQAKPLIKGEIKKDKVKIKVEKEIGTWGDNKYTYEIDLTGVDSFECVPGTFERLTAYESGNYVAKFKNPEGNWCYFFPEGQMPHEK